MGKLLNLLHSEAVRRGLMQTGETVTPGEAFTLVRDMPYIRGSSRDPETTIREWRGTCSGKHYLLKALLTELGIESDLIACTTEAQIDPSSVPGQLRTILEASGGLFVDVHNYLVLKLPEGNMIVDATWPREQKKNGFIVNESFELGVDQEIAAQPIKTWIVPDDRDPQEFKRELLCQNFSPEELRLRDDFIKTLSKLLAQ